MYFKKLMHPTNDGAGDPNKDDKKDDQKDDNKDPNADPNKDDKKDPNVDPDKDDKKDDDKDPNKTFTQEELGKKMAELKRKFKEEKQELEGKLNNFEGMQTKFEELSNTNKTLLEQVSQLETLQKQVEAFNTLQQNLLEDALKKVPENLKDLIPEEGTAQEKLAYIQKMEAKGLLTVGGFSTSTGDNPPNNQKVNVSTLNQTQKLGFLFKKNK